MQESVTNFVLATWTMDLRFVGCMAGKDWRTRVRMLCSVEEGGNEERKREVWIDAE